MILGRDLRKFTSQTIAFAAYRYIAIWILLFAVASQGKVGQSAALVIVAIDIALQAVARAVQVHFADQERKAWHVALTHRVFFRRLIETIQDGGFRHVAADDLFKAASAEAADDIKNADEANPYGAGLPDNAAWHWFGGFVHFLWMSLSSFLYYGSAILLAARMVP